MTNYKKIYFVALYLLVNVLLIIPAYLLDESASAKGGFGVLTLLVVLFVGPMIGASLITSQMRKLRKDTPTRESWWLIVAGSSIVISLIVFIMLILSLSLGRSVNGLPSFLILNVVGLLLFTVLIFWVIRRWEESAADPLLVIKEGKNHD